MNKVRLLILTALIFLLVGCAQADQAEQVAQAVQTEGSPDSSADLPAYKNPALPIPARVDDLLSRMTVEEKLGQMTLIEKNSLARGDVSHFLLGGVLSGGGGYPARRNNVDGWRAMVRGFQQEALSTRLSIPIIYGVDAVHGHNNVAGTVIFPHNIGLGATANPELIRQIGAITALETTATAIKWNYAPVLAVVQDIRWGRSYESYGQDPELVSTLGSAYIRGLQGDDLSAPTSMAATAKHFVGDGGTTWGSSSMGTYMLDQGDTIVDETTLRAIHLPPYQQAIQAGAKVVMVSFSSWNGLKMHANDYLIQTVLKGEMGFDGFVVSDWQGIDQVSGDYYEAVVTSVNAGVDMNMVPYDAELFLSTLGSAVQNGDIPMARVDDAVRRILAVKFQLGLFEDPMVEAADPDLVGSAEHRAVAQEAVSQSLVLLQNDNQALPISRDATVYVAGMAADDLGVQCGGWTIEWQGGSGQITTGTTIFEGLQAIGGDRVSYNRNGQFEAPGEVGIVVIGETPYAEGQGDSHDLGLPPADIQLIERLRAQVDQLIVILVSGRPLIITEQLALADAWVAAWLPGTEGQGVASNLYGDHAFSGKLPFSWPATMDQLPLAETGATPLFPYGFGLETK